MPVNEKGGKTQKCRYCFRRLSDIWTRHVMNACAKNQQRNLASTTCISIPVIRHEKENSLPHCKYSGSPPGGSYISTHLTPYSRTGNVPPLDVDQNLGEVYEANRTLILQNHDIDRTQSTYNDPIDNTFFVEQTIFFTVKTIHFA